MKDSRRVFLAGLVFVLAVPALAQVQPPAPCRDTTYADETRVQKHPRELTQLGGIVVTPSGVRVTGACVAVFNKERKLIDALQADEDGRFAVPDLGPGDYQLVVRSESLCPTSIRIRIVKRKIVKRSLQVRMQNAGSDECTPVASQSESPGDKT